jgi:serine/threonine-protein kinase
MLHPGEVIDGKYEVVRLLGEGGMGAVFEARHLVMDRRVALKVLHATARRREEAVTRFLNEARAAAIIGSDHIVEIFDAGMLPGDVTPYLVMELLEGRDLQEIARAERVLAPARAIDLVGQACEALAAAHRRGIIHRDLKPSNLFVIERGPGVEWVKLLDFGIAKFKDLSQSGATPLTAEGSTLGTPRYMAPEQLGGAEKVDHRADVYALGMILYELVTGALPFGEGSIAQLMARAARARPAPPRQVRPDLDERLEAAILKATSPAPEDRFDSMEDFGRALAGASGDARPARPAPSAPPASAPAPAAAPRPPSGPAPAAAPRPRGTRTLLVALIAGVAGVALAAAGGLVMVWAGAWDRETGGRRAVGAPLVRAQVAAPDVLLPYERMVDTSRVDSSQAPSLGPPSAPVVIYLFTDYQCAPCNRAHPVVLEAVERHRGQVRLVVFNYPIDQACNPRVPAPAHAMACHAAAVAICAEEQGRFWETSAQLHGLTGALDPAAFRGAAARAGLDLARLDQCMAGDRPRLRVGHDLAQATLFGIDVTPVLVVNGRLTPGDPGPRLEALISGLLARGGRWAGSGQTGSATP